MPVCQSWINWITISASVRIIKVPPIKCMYCGGMASSIYHYFPKTGRYQHIVSCACGHEQIYFTDSEGITTTAIAQRGTWF